MLKDHNAGSIDITHWPQCFRTYELQFLLMGQSTSLSNHMVLFLCTQLTGRWMIYDNMKTPLVQDIGVSELQRATERDKYVSYLAAYVKKE